jgi:hypothetical protein
LTPLAVTRDDSALDAVLGTMDADAQPQVLLQLLVRMLAIRVTSGGLLAGAAVPAPVTGPRQAGEAKRWVHRFAGIWGSRGHCGAQGMTPVCVIRVSRAAGRVS